MAQPVALKRSLSLPLVTLYGLGNILGAGIYVLVGKVAGSAGHGAPLAFLAAGAVAALTAFAYAELSARLPLSAGEAVYVQAAYGRRWLSTAVGLLIALSGVVSAAAITRGFVGYVQVFLTLPEAAVIVLALVVLGGLAAWGINESVGVAAAFTVIEVLGLVLIVAVATFGAGRGTGDLGARLAQSVAAAPWGDPLAWQGALMGAFLAFYAFIGFEDMVNVAEEVRDARRNLPLAIFLALGVATVLYALVATTAVLAVPPDRLSASDAPLALVYREVTGRAPVLITSISLFAVINGALIQVIMASRVVYGMSRQGWLPALLGRVEARTRTPVVATALVTAVVAALALAGTVKGLATATSFLLLVVFALINLGLVLIKGRDPHPQGVRTWPLWIPLAGVVVNLAFVAFQVVSLVG